MNEFAIEWVKGRAIATATAPSATKLKSRLMKLAADYPDDVEIVKENNDGSIVAHAPVSWVRISPPRKVSEKQRKAASERLKKYREQKAATKDDWDEEDWEELEEENGGLPFT